MLMVGLAPCAFSLTESDYSRRKKAMGTCRPQSFLSTNPSVQEGTHPTPLFSCNHLQTKRPKILWTSVHSTKPWMPRAGSSAAQSTVVQSRCCGRAPLQLHHLCFTGETMRPEEPRGSRTSSSAVQLGVIHIIDSPHVAA
ncbi:hypothetical protein ACQJBY_054430 [Aegilops geniculata]